MILILGLALCVQSIGAYFLLQYSFNRGVAQKIEASAVTYAHLMQNGAYYYVSRGDLTALLEHLHLALYANHVTDAIALNCEGEIYSAGDRSQVGSNIQAIFPDHSEHAFEAMFERNAVEVAPSIAGEAIYHSFIPLPCPTYDLSNWGPSEGGALVFRSDFSELIREEQYFYLRLGAVQLLLSAGFLLLGLLLLYKYIAAKLGNLSSGMQTFSSEDPDYRYDGDGDDEIDGIGQSFNLMADTIQRQFVRIQNTNRRLALTDKVFELTSVGMVILSEDLMILDANPAFTELNGYKLNDVLGKSFDFLTQDLHQRDRLSMISEATNQESAIREFWTRSANGTRFRKAIKLSTIRTEDAEISHYFAIERNVTDDHLQKVQLRALASTDSLTGLKNRRRMELDIAEIEMTQRGCYAIASIDLDGLKEINNKYGHIAGDKMIVEASRRLDQQVENIAFGLYRLAGDEFCVILNQPGDEHEVTRICRAIMASVEGALDLEMVSTDLTVGLGVAIYDPDRHESIQDLIIESDIALKEAKRAGRSSFFVATEESLRAQKRRTNISLALKSPSLEDQIQVSYLPKVDIQNNILSGAEALVRWTSPDLGFVQNEEFIPIAEETGDITKIDDWVMRRAISDAAQFGELVDGFQTTINVSPRQLFKSDYADELILRLKDAEIDSENFSLEITEWTAIQHHDRFLPVLNALRAAGIAVELDDFGTGHSSLVNLHRLPIDALKIDRNFVHSMGTNNASLEIVRSIIMLARSMNMSVVAEGVENQVQLEVLKELGCDYCQGYLYSEPIVVDDRDGLVSAISQWQETIESLG